MQIFAKKKQNYFAELLFSDVKLTLYATKVQMSVTADCCRINTFGQNCNFWT